MCGKGGYWHWAYARRGTPAQIFFRFGLSRFSEDIYDVSRMKVLFLNKSLLVKNT